MRTRPPPTAPLLAARHGTAPTLAGRDESAVIDIRLDALDGSLRGIDGGFRIDHQGLGRPYRRFGSRNLRLRRRDSRARALLGCAVVIEDLLRDRISPRQFLGARELALRGIELSLALGDNGTRRGALGLPLRDQGRAVSTPMRARRLLRLCLPELCLKLSCVHARQGLPDLDEVALIHQNLAITGGTRDNVDFDGFDAPVSAGDTGGSPGRIRSSHTT